MCQGTQGEKQICPDNVNCHFDPPSGGEKSMHEELAKIIDFSLLRQKADSFEMTITRRFVRKVIAKSTILLLAFLFVFNTIAPVWTSQGMFLNNIPQVKAAPGGQASSGGNMNPAVSVKQEAPQPFGTMEPANLTSAPTGNTQNSSTQSMEPASAYTADAASSDSAPAVDQLSADSNAALQTGKAKKDKSLPATGNSPALQTSSISGGSGGSNNPSSNKTQAESNLPKSDGVSGALTYEYPLTVPSGRNNLEPDLKLNYNSQNLENGAIFGHGWSLNIPSIERLNKNGVNNLYSQSYFYSSLSGELVNISGTSYGSKVENGEFLKYEFSNNSWTATDKQGTKYKFGLSASSRQDNPNDTAKVFKWMLEEVRDTSDNFMRYEYFKDQGQIYPSKIFYTGSGTTDGIFTVEFAREARTDAATSYRTGFSVKTNYRINEVTVKTNGVWTKKYSIAYATGDNTARSVASSITESGQNEAGIVTALPAESFAYRTNNFGYTTDSNWYPPVDLRRGVIIADFNGDGLDDFMQSYWNGSETKRTYFSDGQGYWTLSSNLIPPILFGCGGGCSPTDAGVRSADINGDGLADLIQLQGYGINAIRKVFINTGSGWIQNSIENVGLFFNDGINDLDYGTRLADINGDGLPDILRTYTAAYGVIEGSLYLNNGNNTWTNTYPWQFPADIAKGVIIADINGDGLDDMVQSYENYPTVLKNTYLNDGKGNWIINSNLLPPVIFNRGGNSSPQDMGVRSADINGDGLADLIQLQGGSSAQRRVFINTGSGWLEKQLTSVGAVFNDGVMDLDTGTRLMNINGDGLMDIIKVIQAPGQPEGVLDKSIYINNGPKPDLLSQITYPQGGQTSITYKATAEYRDASNNLLNPNLPLVLNTVYQINHLDGLGGTVSSSTYSYEGGKYYFDSNNPFDRKFSGFAKVTSTDSSGNTIKTYFHQGDATNSSQGEYQDNYYKIGKPYRTEVYDNANNLYSKTIDKWESYDLGNSRSFVKLAQTIESTYDGNATHKDKAETYAYDNTNGNLITKTKWGEVTGSDDGTFIDTGTDKLATNISYASNLTTNVIGLPSQETTLDQNNAKVKESKYYYDNLALGSADKGNLTKEEKWVSGSTYINTQKSYNSYGLATSKTDPRGKTTTYVYDSVNLYPISVTDPLNHTIQYQYNYSTGKPKQITDPNGYIYQTIYDGLGRITEEKQPDLTTPSTLVTKSAYLYTDTAGAVSIKKTDYLDETNSADSYSYFDGLGRLIQTRKEAETANTFSVKDFVYNNRGLLEKESLPYFSTGSTRTTATADSTLYLNYSYDPLERITSTTNAVGTITNSYDDWKVTTIDAKGTPKDLYKDAYGNLIQVGEHSGASVYTTTYNYDGAGNLTKITDASGNIRNFTYDGLGKRLTAEDLHAPSDATFGVWTYAYDESGNLTSQLDPKGQTVNYTYDDLNRQLTEDYTGQTGTEKSYVYDTCTGGIGKLCQANSNSNGANAKSPSAHWSFDEGTGTIAYDSSGNENTGTLTNSPTWSSGMSGTALDFDGINDYVNIPHNVSLNPTASGFSISLWVEGGSNNNVNGAILDKGQNQSGGFLIQDFSGSSSKLTFYVMGLIPQSVTATFTTISLSAAMHHIVCIYDSSNNKLLIYKDGELDNSVSVTGAPGATNTSPLYLATDIYTSNFFNGKIDEVRIYNQALSPNEVQSLYQNSSPGSSLETFEYNALGLVKKNIKAIGLTNYTASYVYDRQENNTLLANPDNSQVKYIYNSAGLLNQIQRKENLDAGFSDLVTAINYSPLEKIIYQTDANGASTTNTYDAAKLYRLASKVTTIPGGNHAQDLVYTYDANGNITRIVDNSSTNSKKTTDYTYDSLNRLLTATATGAINGQNYAETYAYDAIGNITSKNGQPYSYSNIGKTNPHAVTSIGSTNYAYDDNGNLLTDGTLTNSWDYDNRLTQTMIGMSTVNYAYNAEGQRIKYSNGTTTTVYPTKFYNTDGAVPAKHIYVGDQLVATIKGTGSNAQVYSVHTDHLTGSNVVTNSNGTVEELMDYYPYGDIRLDEKPAIAIDSSGNNNTGTLVNMESRDWVQGKVNTALDFDGVNEYVDAGNGTSLNISNTITISAWVNSSSSNAWSRIVDKGYGTAFDLSISQNGNNLPVFRIWGSGYAEVSSPVSVIDGNWHHVVATYDGTQMKLYSDGVLRNSSPYTGTIGTTASNLYIGWSSGGSSGTSEYFKGKIDEVRIYNRALSQPEISALYNNPTSINNTGLAGYWKFDTANEQRKYAGKELDAETGLYYYGARYYNGKMGRFVSEDEAFWDFSHVQTQLVDPQSWNSYAYGRNNPLRYNDPDGQFWDTAIDLGFTGMDVFNYGKNLAEATAGAVNIGIGSLMNNQRIINAGDAQLAQGVQSMNNLRGDLAIDAVGTALPFVPIAGLKGVNKVNDVIKISEKYSWGRAETLEKHFIEHGADFGVKSAEGYAQKAQQFYNNAQKNKYDQIVGRDGVKRIYDPKTNTFGSFNPDGSTKTFYKPTQGQRYWQGQANNPQKNIKINN